MSALDGIDLNNLDMDRLAEIQSALFRADMRARKTPPVSKVPVNEARDGLNHFDEVAVKVKLKAPLDDAPANDQYRALVWIYDNRDGAKMSWDDAMRLTRRQALDYFADPVDDDDLTPAGKAGPPSEPANAAEPNGASTRSNHRKPTTN